MSRNEMKKLENNYFDLLPYEGENVKKTKYKKIICRESLTNKIP